jgi:hypothetical protein
LNEGECDISILVRFDHLLRKDAGKCRRCRYVKDAPYKEWEQDGREISLVD